MPKISDERTDQIVNAIAFVPMVVYICVAFLLSIIALISLIESMYEIYVMITTLNWVGGITNVIYAILFTIIIIELFETVTAYLKTKRVPVKALLIVALTAVVRHLIVINVSDTPFLEYIGLSVVLAVLIAGIFLIKDSE